MLQQEATIEPVRRVCRLEGRLVAMMYGSFAQPEGDEFTHIEFVYILGDGALKYIDQKAWVDQADPGKLYLVDEFGIGPAVFGNLVRGEFNVDEAFNIEKIHESCRETDWISSLDATLVLDRTGNHLAAHR